MAKMRSTRSSKRLDMYNFETSEECIKLEFSFDKENTGPRKRTDAHKKKSKRKGDTGDLANEAKTKRPKVDTNNKIKHAPAFEFFSTKKKKSRLSDSGIFMTPSPVQFDGNITPTVKPATPTSSLKSSINPCRQTLVNCDDGRSKRSAKFRVNKAKADQKQPIKQTAKFNTVSKTSSKESVRTTKSSDILNALAEQSKPKRCSPRFTKQTAKHNSSTTPIEQGKPTKSAIKKVSGKSTSTPSMPLRSRSVKNKDARSHFTSPPEVSPVHKVDSPTGHVMTSPDFCGSPSFQKTAVQSSSVLQNSLAENSRRTTRARAAKSSVERAPAAQAASAQEYNSLMDESMFTPDSPVKGPPQSKTDNSKRVQKSAESEKKANVASTDEYNSLMDESMFTPDSPVKSPPKQKTKANKSRTKKHTVTSSNKDTSAGSEAANKTDEIASFNSDTEVAAVDKTTSASVNKYSAEQRSLSIKKHGRYSTSKVEAWAREVNSEFDDLEQYELSID